MDIVSGEIPAASELEIAPFRLEDVLLGAALRQPRGR